MLSRCGIQRRDNAYRMYFIIPREKNTPIAKTFRECADIRALSNSDAPSWHLGDFLNSCRYICIAYSPPPPFFRPLGLDFVDARNVTLVNSLLTSKIIRVTDFFFLGHATLLGRTYVRTYVRRAGAHKIKNSVRRRDRRTSSSKYALATDLEYSVRYS